LRYRKEVVKMIKLTKRKGFNFFRSYFDVYNELENDADKVAFIDALLDRQFMGVKPLELKGMAKFAYISQTNSIDSQVKGYEDKTRNILHPTDGLILHPPVGVITTPPQQVEVKDKVQVKEVISIIDRKLKFYDTLKPFLETYDRDLIRAFYDYWTEHGEKDKKMRFEKEKSFGLSRRLANWKSKDYGKTNTDKKQTQNELTQLTNRLRG
jgi:hypothetical protein